MIDYLNELGKPTLRIADLRIWVHGRERPEDDWLITSIHCGKDNSGPWIHYAGALNVYYDLRSFVVDLEKLSNKTTTKVVSEFTEPYLSLKFEINPLYPKTAGEIELRVNFILGAVFEENYQFVFWVSQEELKAFISELKSLLLQYPIEGWLEYL